MNKFIDLLFSRPLLDAVAMIRRHPVKAALACAIIFAIGEFGTWVALGAGLVFGNKGIPSKVAALLAWLYGWARWLIPAALFLVGWRRTGLFFMAWFLIDTVWPGHGMKKTVATTVTTSTGTESPAETQANSEDSLVNTFLEYAPFWGGAMARTY